MVPDIGASGSELVEYDMQSIHFRVRGTWVQIWLRHFVDRRSWARYFNAFESLFLSGRPKVISIISWENDTFKSISEYSVLKAWLAPWLTHGRHLLNAALFLCISFQGMTE